MCIHFGAGNGKVKPEKIVFSGKKSHFLFHRIKKQCVQCVQFKQQGQYSMETVKEKIPNIFFFVGC